MAENKIPILPLPRSCSENELTSIRVIHRKWAPLSTADLLANLTDGFVDPTLAIGVRLSSNPSVAEQVVERVERRIRGVRRVIRHLSTAVVAKRVNEKISHLE